MTTNVSQPAVDRYFKIGAASASKILMFPKCIDVQRFCGASGEKEAIRKSLGSADEFVWLAIGNLCDAKDYPTMLEPFR
jgi:hypothetical protein